MEKWILFDAYNDYFSANLMLTKLRSENFTCELRDEKTASIDPMLSNAIGGIKLMILAKQEEAVKEWYARYKEAQLGQQYCPKCKQQTVIKNPQLNKSSSIISFFKHLYNPHNREFKVFMCEDCYAAFDEVILNTNQN